MKARLPQNMQPNNLNQMLKQAQKAQEDMAALQEDLEGRTYTASSGGGAVEVTVTGKHHLESVKINPDVVDPDDVEMLQDLIIAAVNEAVSSAEATAEREMSAITGSLNMPGVL